MDSSFCRHGLRSLRMAPLRVKSGAWAASELCLQIAQQRTSAGPVEMSANCVFTQPGPQAVIQAPRKFAKLRSISRRNGFVLDEPAGHNRNYAWCVCRHHHLHGRASGISRMLRQTNFMTFASITVLRRSNRSPAVPSRAPRLTLPPAPERQSVCPCARLGAFFPWYCRKP